ncbi:MAG: O-antigen ligase family protein, partial [Candidatus Omnitrophica bacterium]|nr:O-antigen ligase family protein [Candidatus Omnitrophota bacterium]
LILLVPWSNEQGLATAEWAFTVFPAYWFALAGMAFTLRDEIGGRRVVPRRHPGRRALWFFLSVLVVSIFQSRHIPLTQHVPMSTAVSLFTRGRYTRSISQVAAIFFMAGICYFVLAAVRSRRVLRRATGVYVAAAGLTALLMSALYLLARLGHERILSFVAHAAGNAPPVALFVERGVRIQGFFSEPLAFGTYLVSAIPLTLCMCFTPVRLRYRLLSAAAFFLECAVLGFTLSRGAWLGWLTAMAVLAALLLAASPRGVQVFLLIILLVVATGAAALRNSFFSKQIRRHPLTAKVRALTVEQAEVVLDIEKYAAMSRENCAFAGEFYRRKKVQESEYTLSPVFGETHRDVLLYTLHTGRIWKEATSRRRGNRGREGRWLRPEHLDAEITEQKEVFGASPGVPHLISSLAWSTAIRFNDIAAGVLMARDYPFLGVGWGNYIFRYLDYDPQLMGWWWIDCARTQNRPGTPICCNLFVSIIAESGILGLGSFLLFVSLVFFAGVRGFLRSRDRAVRLIQAGLVSGFAGVLVCYQFFSTLYYPFVWVVIGLILATEFIDGSAKILRERS